MRKIGPVALQKAQGQEIGLSAWCRVDQARIDAFAEVSGDRQFIHVDPDRAASSVFGGIVAHGMLSLSIMSGMAATTLPEVEGQKAAINFGLETLRFRTPVRPGDNIRARFVLSELTRRGRGDLLARFAVKLEIEGEKRPALTADWLILYVF
ncbi:MaoC family dehydratase [Sulfitobacter aestuarii]|uniref:MaoC family dehydratase n=1 Tax=Sulfitobacter aestuarii TaxID=2161676 RepID=A0ABW5TX78_9RHOB